MTDNQVEVDASSAPLVEHLRELRQRLIWSIAAFIGGVVLAFPFWKPVFNFLSSPICTELAERGQDCGLVLIKLQEGFFTAVSIAVLCGLALSFPVIGYQLWRFVAPGLYRKEKAAFLPFLVASPAMFLLGGAMAFYLVLPTAYSFFLDFQQGPVEVDKVSDRAASASIVFQGSMQEYLGLTVRFITAFGLCFQLPVLLTLLGKAELVSADDLVRVRKYAFVATLLLSAVATPPDIVSQIILFATVYPLYEIAILIIGRMERRRDVDRRP